MQHALYHLLYSAMLLLPLHSIAQTFNHIYPSGGDRLGIFVEQINGGYGLVANASPLEAEVRFIHIQTDAQGVQLNADTTLFDNTFPNDGRYTRLYDGTFAFVRATGNSDVKLTKKTADGTELWSQEYELPYYSDVLPGVVVEGNGGELFIYGYLSDWFSFFGQFYVIKATADGQELWVKTFSLFNNNETYFPRVEGAAATADGGFVLVANSQNQVKFFLRFDAGGNRQVINSVNSYNANPTLALEGSPGKAVFAYSASTGSFSNYNTAAMFAQYDWATGQLDWETQLEPFNTPIFPQQTFITAISKTTDGGYLLAGHGSANGQADRFFLAKLDGMGQVIWNKHDYGFTATPSFLRETPTGGILVAGRRDDLAWLMLTNSIGNVDCITSYTNTSAIICEGESYEFAGQSLTEAGTYTQSYQTQGPCDSIVTLTLTVNPLDTNEYSESLCLGEVSYLTDNQYLQAGHFVETATYQNIQGCDSTLIYHIYVDSTIFIEGWAHVPYGEVFLGQVITQSGWYGSTDTSEFGCVTIAVFEVYVIYGAASDKLSEQIGLKVSPNPFCDEANISFKLPTSATVSASILDAQGRRTATLLMDEKMSSGEHQLSVRTEGWSSGVYFLQIMVDGQMGSKRMVKGCR